MRSIRVSSLFLSLVGVAIFGCNSSSNSPGDADGAACFPDNDGINGGSYTIDLVVNDTGFFASGGDDAGAAVAKNIIATQNDAQVTFTLTNQGTKPHGFEVECTSITPSYPNVPAGCSTMTCFPSDSTIPTLAPGASMTITFDTPTPDGLLYPFKSAVAADSTVPGLNAGQWSLE